MSLSRWSAHLAGWTATLALMVSPLSGQVYTDVIPGVKTGGSRNIKVLSPPAARFSRKDRGHHHRAGAVPALRLHRPPADAVRRGHHQHQGPYQAQDPLVVADREPGAPSGRRVAQPDVSQEPRAGTTSPMHSSSPRAGPNVRSGAVVWDITGMPDTSKIKEVARIRMPERPGGFHETYSYKHSNGQPCYSPRTQTPWANVYDMDKVVAAGQNGATRLGRQGPAFPTPPRRLLPAAITTSTWRTIPANNQDMFYGAGAGGYYVYDITDFRTPSC